MRLESNISSQLIAHSKKLTAKRYVLRALGCFPATKHAITSSGGSAKTALPFSDSVQTLITPIIKGFSMIHPSINNRFKVG
jgi:hypothetical protein